MRHFPKFLLTTLPVLLTGTAVLTLMACAQRADVQITGMHVMDHHELSTSAPVRLRLYPLRSDTTFRSATVDDLLANDEMLLKADLTHAPTITSVIPQGDGAPGTVEVELGDGATWLGVLAQYSSSEAADHRMLLVPVNDAKRVVVTCSGLAITAAQQGRQ